MAPLVLVDARNVLRSRWPNLTEEELAERIDAWAKREGQIAVVVFDGRALGKTGERRLSPACSLVGTGGESADDWIARRAAELAASGRPYWLVTSDRELRRRAGGAAERTIGGGSFVRTVAGD
ncbi:MAG: NYN domain-containing protein [Actinomycetota bacterium]|nr:NYN domain-containing protein [Actinomycetota bacterium]